MWKQQELSLVQKQKIKGGNVRLKGEEIDLWLECLQVTQSGQGK